MCNNPMALNSPMCFKFQYCFMKLKKNPSLGVGLSLVFKFLNSMVGFGLGTLFSNSRTFELGLERGFMPCILHTLEY